MNKHQSASALIEAGIAAETDGDAANAERLFLQAVEIDPDSAQAHMNLGIALHAKGDFSGALIAHSESVRLEPNFAQARYNRALALIASGRWDEAEQDLRAALDLKADFPEAWVGLAEALETNGRDEQALAALDTAIFLRPHYVGALFNNAVLLRRLGRLDEAETRLRGVEESHPDYANAMVAMAATLRDQGRVDEAVHALRRALERAPDSQVAQSELLFTLGYSDGISAEALFKEHSSAGLRAQEASGQWCRHFPNIPDADRPLKVGYLSGDFAGTAVALFTEFLFERHDRDRVKVFAYSSTSQPDPTTARFAASADRWRDMKGATDEAVAKAILEDGIDVLVDLTGHTSHRRIGVLAGRAAPVQMTWLGYINTTGLTRVDYRITDTIADPPGVTEEFHTERLLRMPDSQWCFRPPTEARKIDAYRDPALGAFTLGSFNQSAKITESAIALWAQALRTCPEARLRVIGIPQGLATERFGRMFSDEGIDPLRCTFVERLSLDRYYREFSRVDACLDTTPYSGGTTTCDAIWMGVPVVTLAGERSMSRSAASILTSLGRVDLVARTSEEFTAIVSRLATQREWSSRNRADLRMQMIGSPLMDEAGFTKALEDLYLTGWRNWCASAVTPYSPHVPISAFKH